MYIGEFTLTDSWVNLKTRFTPHLTVGQKYEIYNGSMNAIKLLEVSAAPADGDTRGLPISGGTSRIVTVAANVGVYVRARKSTVHTSVVVVEG